MIDDIDNKNALWQSELEEIDPLMPIVLSDYTTPVKMLNEFMILTESASEVVSAYIHGDCIFQDSSQVYIYLQKAKMYKTLAEYARAEEAYNAAMMYATRRMD